jgi:hypothetical protein
MVEHNIDENQGKQKPSSSLQLQSWIRPWSLIIMVGLILIFLHFNSRREFTMTLPNGATMKVVNSESLSDALMRQLSPTTNSTSNAEDREAKLRREMLIAALLAVLKNQKSTDQLGKELIKIAKASDNPFSWSDRNAKIVYSSAVPLNHFRICAKDFQDWKGSLVRVSVFDPNITDESSVTSEATVDGAHSCDQSRLINDDVEIQTSIRSLYEASKKPGAVAKAILRVTIPW